LGWGTLLAALLVGGTSLSVESIILDVQVELGIFVGRIDTGGGFVITDVLTIDAFCWDTVLKTSRIRQFNEGGLGSNGDWVTSRARKLVILTTVLNTSISKKGRGINVKRSTVVIGLSTFHEGRSGGEDINTILGCSITYVFRIASTIISGKSA